MRIVYNQRRYMSTIGDTRYIFRPSDTITSLSLLTSDVGSIPAVEITSIDYNRTTSGYYHNIKSTVSLDRIKLSFSRNTTIDSNNVSYEG